MRPRHLGPFVAAKLCLGTLAVITAPGLGQPAWGQADPGRPSAAADEPSPGSLTQGGPIQGGRRVPFDRETVEERQRAAGIAADAERERRQLEDLNAISRKLTPPGTPLPAPHLEPQR
jgi:hypothetical protein